MNKFVNFQQIMKIRSTSYPFLISNTDSFDKDGTHWWGILDIHLKAEIFFFDSFGLDGLKNFVIQDDQKIVQKRGIEKMTKTDNKLTLVKINFSLKTFATLKSGEFESMSKTAQVFNHFIESFGKLHQLKDFVCVWMLEDPTQKLETSTCEPFQLYFFGNLFNPDKNS